MVTWGQISEWQDLPLLEAYARISMAEASIENNGEVLYRAELKFNSEGEAAESARRVIQELRQDVDLVEGQLSDFMIAIRCAAIEVEELAFRVRSVQITAASALLEINDVGEVSYSQTLWNMINVEFRNILEVTPEEWLHLVSQSDTSAWRRAAPVKVELEAEIQSLLARAHEIDERLGQACRAIVGGRVSDSVAVVSAGDVSGEAALDVLNELSGVPAEVRAFWDSLSVSLQESLIENFPEILGALNGIPFADRLRANRLNSLRRVRDLNDQIQDLDRQIDALKPGMSEREAFDLADLRSKRSELQQEVSYINSVLDDPGRGFVLFDPENNRLIEQNGSLSGVVDEVYTHVPGTGTSLASFIDESATAFPVALREEGSVQGVEVSLSRIWMGVMTLKVAGSHGQVVVGRTQMLSI